MTTRFALLLALFCSSALSAVSFGDIELTDEIIAQIPPPFSVNGEYLSIEKAKFTTPDVKGEHLKYSQAAAAFSYKQPFSTTWGLVFGAQYAGSYLEWSQNPDFDQTDFHYVSFSLGAFCIALEDWIWALQFSIDMDTEELSLSEYSLYNAVLYGKYTLCEWISVTAGFILQIGLNKEKIWPLVGFEFLPAEAWRLSVVFPMDVSLTYSLCDLIDLATSVRFLRTRHRVSENEPNPRGIFEYRDTGIELDLNLNPFEHFTVKGFVGRTFEGDLKITDRNDNNATHYKFDGALFAGISANLDY